MRGRESERVSEMGIEGRCVYVDTGRINLHFSPVVPSAVEKNMAASKSSTRNTNVWVKKKVTFFWLFKAASWGSDSVTDFAEVTRLMGSHFRATDTGTLR